LALRDKHCSVIGAEDALPIEEGQTVWIEVDTKKISDGIEHFAEHFVSPFGRTSYLGFTQTA
jgi:hypothetical protein